MNWPNSKDILLLVEREIANSISKIDDFVKHVFREHNQEADQWANLGAEEQRTTAVDKGSNTERWKAVQGFWDGSSTNNGRSRCGVVIKGVDKDKWITISKIAAPLGIGTARSDGSLCSHQHRGSCGSARKSRNLGVWKRQVI